MTRQIKAKKNDGNKTTFTRQKSKRNKLNKFLQAESDIYDKAIELYLKDKYSLFKYQSFNPLLLKREESKSKNSGSDSESETSKEEETHEIEPDERSKLIKTDFTYPESDGQAFCRMSGWNGNMYVPPVFSNSYQLSIWKVDDFGIVKVVNKYFTPKNKKANEPKFAGFNLELSLDEQTMLAIEKEADNQMDQVVIAFDPYSLEILSEISLSTVNVNIRNQPYYQGDISEILANCDCRYRISDQVPKITSWNFGEYIIAGVSTKSETKVIYKWDIFTTKTHLLVSSINRNENVLLQDNVLSITPVEHSETLLHFTTSNNKLMRVLEIDIITGTIEVVAQYNGFSPIYAYPTEDDQSIYIINQDK